MDFSVNWIGRYVELPGIDELADALTAAGLAVEGREQRGNDVLFDVDVTTNRPDCMNHLGLAREVAVLFDRPLQWPPVELEETDERVEDVVSIELSTPDCPEYVARVVRGIQVGPSPEWLREALESIGQRSINNVVDVTNFVLWETGQPIHAFDLDKISGARIEVRYARGGEKLETLDGVVRELGPKVMVIADAERPVALAGIMGGLDSEVTESTRDVLIESAHFDRTAVRLGARGLGMHTDASHRFERGADPLCCRPAADRVAELLVECAGGTVSAGALENPHPDYFGSFEGTLDLERLDAFAGTDYPRDQVERIYGALGFDPQPEGENQLRMTVPSWRYYDFWQRREDGSVWEADLFEEAMRIFGLDAIPADLPSLGAPDSGTSLEYRKRERVREALAARGYCEAINFAFGSRAADTRFPGLALAGEPLEIANPLSEQYVLMRRSLLPNLLENASFNARHGASSVGLFEVGRIFPGGESDEIEAVALVAGGSSPISWDRPTSVDFFELKGVVESLFELFDRRLEVGPAELAGLVSGSGAEILSGEERIGYLGEVADTDLVFPLFAAEVAVSSLVGAERPEPVQAPSRFPGVAADFTLTHDLSVGWAELEAAIVEARSDHLVEFGLRDRYSGKGVPEGAVNTTVYFLYNADDRSLTQDEVNERQRALTDELQRRFGRRA